MKEDTRKIWTMLDQPRSQRQLTEKPLGDVAELYKVSDDLESKGPPLEGPGFDSLSLQTLL